MTTARTCTAPNCNRRHLARGYCNAHYKQWAAGEPFRTPRIHRRDWNAFIEDAEWIASTGETRARAATRLQLPSIEALERTLQRLGRTDIYARLTALESV